MLAPRFLPAAGIAGVCALAQVVGAVAWFTGRARLAQWTAAIALGGGLLLLGLYVQAALHILDRVRSGRAQRRDGESRCRPRRDPVGAGSAGRAGRGGVSLAGGRARRARAVRSDRGGGARASADTSSGTPRRPWSKRCGAPPRVGTAMPARRFRAAPDRRSSCSRHGPVESPARPCAATGTISRRQSPTGSRSSRRRTVPTTRSSSTSRCSSGARDPSPARGRRDESGRRAASRRASAGGRAASGRSRSSPRGASRCSRRPAFRSSSAPRSLRAAT